jgi:hypothetical protein
MPFAKCHDSGGFPTTVEYFDPAPNRPSLELLKLASGIVEGGADSVVLDFEIQGFGSPTSLLRRLQGMFGYPNVLIRTLSDSGSEIALMNKRYGAYFEAHKEFFTVPPGVVNIVKARPDWVAAHEVGGVPYVFCERSKDSGFSLFAAEQLQKVRRLVTAEPQLVGLVVVECVNNFFQCSFRIGVDARHASVLTDVMQSFQPWHFYSIKQFGLINSKSAKIVSSLNREALEGLGHGVASLSVVIEVDKLSPAFLDLAAERFSLEVKGQLSALLRRSFVAELDPEVASAIFFVPSELGEVSLRWRLREGKPRQFSLTLSNFSDRRLENCFGWLLQQFAEQGGRIGASHSLRGMFAGQQSVYDTLPNLADLGGVSLDLQGT